MPVIVKALILPFVGSHIFAGRYDDKFSFALSGSQDIKGYASFSFALAGAVFSMEW